MLRLRKLLLCRTFFYFIFFLTCVITFFHLSFPKYSKYFPNQHQIVGKVIEKRVDGNTLTMVIDGKERVLVKYYFETKNEKLDLMKKLSLGDNLKLVGDLKKPTATKTEGLFDYEVYLKRQGIFYILEVKEIYLEKKNTNFLLHLKESIMRRCKSPYLKTFILGDTSDISNQTLKDYRDIGISHLFAISGMHISLLSSFLLKLLKGLKLQEKTRYFLVFLFLLFYLLLTGLSPSILRAVLFFLFFSINEIYYFHINKNHIFIVVFSFSLLLNENYIYDVGFLYSFSISFSLLYLSDYINQYQHYFSKLLMVSFISFFTSLPISLYFFNQINLLSIFYNLFYVPLISMIIFPIALFSFLLPLLTPILDFLIYILELSSSFFAQISFSKLIFCQVNFFIYGFYEILLFLSLKTIQKKKYLPCFLLIFTLVSHFLYPKILDHPYLLMIDVGQGDSILLHSKNKNILIDTGGVMSYQREKWKTKKNQYSIVESTTIPLLKKRGISKIDHLILTHGDYDHLGETKNLIQNFKVGNIYINEGKINSLEQELFRYKNKVEVLRQNETLEIGNFQIVSLNHDLNDENDSSLILYVKINNKKMLFMGDASIKSERELLNNYEIGKIDILKVGHHGSDTSSSEYFINSITPKICLISVGENNKFGHPKEIVLSILDSCNVYRTDISGSIEIKL